MQIGLIAEGASELRILKHIIGRYLGTEHDINEIQPKTNAQGTQIVPGGWDRVITTFEFENTVKDALVENDYVLIQIDTDQAQTVPFSVNVLDENGQYCKPEVLHQRVSERILNNIPNLIDSERERVILAICISEIECWLLPLYYNDSKRCKTTGCITLLNQKLSSNKIDPLPNGNKNSQGAQKTYNIILKNLKKPKEIEECAQYNYGFYSFIEPLKGIKTIIENEE